MASGAGLVWSTPKTYERRSVPFPAALADELAALMVGKDRDALVFADLRRGVLPNSNWRARVFAPAVAVCQKADESFPTIKPYDLRHTAVSMTLDTYADLCDTDLDAVAVELDAAIKAAATEANPSATAGRDG